LPAGYFATVDATALDCDDDNPGLLRLLSYVGRDRDADTYVVAEAGVVCAGATLPGGYFATVDATALDCDDASAAVWRTASVFIDADLDNVGSGAGDSRCIGTSVPLGSSLVGGDCDDTNATLMASLPYSARDEDGDARQRVESGSLCVGSALPSGYFATLGADVDCDDRDPAKWRVVALYQDIDGDGVGSGPYQLQCIGSYAGPGLSLRGYDPLDSTTDPDSLRVSDFDLGIRIFVDPTPEEEEIL
jgi:hypothetical protein